MTLPADYISGTITLTNGSVNFTGTGTGWLAADFREGDMILDVAGGDNRVAVVQTITANGTGTLSKPWEGPTLTGVAYRIRYQWDSSRVSAQTRTMIENLGNGNLESFSGVTGPGVVVMDGPHSVVVKPETDFINGVAYDVQVDLLADRAAYDGQSAGYSVLVSDIGDGRSAIYSKASNTVGDWTAAAFVTGPVGPLPDVTVGTVTTGDPGTSVIITPTPIVGGVELDFTIPSGRGAVVMGDYNPATGYVLDDAVLYNGSTFIALQSTTGNAPPTLPTTSNAYWQLLARQGIDGAGTVNSVVAGDGIAIDNTDPTAPVISSTVPPTDTSGIEANIAAMAFEIADLRGVRLNMAGGIADAYDSEDDVDTAASTNEDYIAADDLYRPTQTGTAIAINSNDATAALGGNTTFDRTTMVLNSVIVSKIGVYSTSALTYVVKMAKRNGSSSIDVVVSQSFSHPGGGWADCTLSSPYTVPASGEYYIGAYTASGTVPVKNSSARILIGGGNPGVGTGVSTSEDADQVYPMRYEHSAIANDMTLVSDAFAATAVPNTARAAIFIHPQESITVTTDLTVEVSRDNGASWAAAVLEPVSNPAGSVEHWEDNEIDISGQTSGSAMLYRIKTLNSKDIDVTGIVFQWS